MDERCSIGRTGSKPGGCLESSSGVIANPNCTTIQMVVALKAIENLSHIKRVHVSTISCQWAGATAMAELETYAEPIIKGRGPTVEKFGLSIGI